jgi:SAM-dependent methyltransferase
MDPSDILKSLIKYKNNEFESQFLEKTIEYFTDNKDIIWSISDNPHLLAGLRIHLLSKKHHIYLVTKLPSFKICHRELKLSKNAASNLINQIYGITQNTFNICKDLPEHTTTYYLVISKNVIKTKDIDAESIYNDIKQEISKDSKTDTISKQGEVDENIWLPLLGIHSLYFLEHQNIAKYCEPEKMKNAAPLFKTLTSIRDKLKKLPWNVRDRFIVISGLIYHFLGAVLTSDVDMIVVEKQVEDIKKYTEYLDEVKDLMFVGTGKSNNYLYRINFYKNILPQMGGSENIFENLINPEHHFYFMGLKCIDIYTNFQISVGRAHPFAYTDILMLKNVNDIPFWKEYCLKNITIRRGVAHVVNDNKDMEHFISSVIKYMELWNNIKVSRSWLKENIKKCSEKSGTIYTKNITEQDPITTEQIILHRKISQNYIYKYGKRSKSLLDIGFGKLTGGYIYNKIGLEHVYGVEPSDESIKTALEKVDKLKKEGSNINFNLIKGYGDKYIPFNRKFDLITYIFTIHYMMNNVAGMMKNLHKFCHNGTRIIITCINGNKLIDNLRTTGKYEIRHDNDIFWGAYKYNDDLNKMPARVLFFFKGVYGVENGSEEWLIDIDRLIELFKKNNMQLEHRNNFLDEYNHTIKPRLDKYKPNKTKTKTKAKAKAKADIIDLEKNDDLDGKEQTHDLLPFQKQLLSLHEVLIFKYSKEFNKKTQKKQYKKTT